jgi:hypothetical protein
MLRNIVPWFLLLTLQLNGLWLVCDDTSTEGQAAAAASAALSQEQIDCLRICAMKHQAAGGGICIILPGDAKASITVIDFGVAILPADIELRPIAIAEEFLPELPFVYSAPAISNATPPPKV